LEPFEIKKIATDFLTLLYASSAFEYFFSTTPTSALQLHTKYLQPTRHLPTIHQYVAKYFIRKQTFTNHQKCLKPAHANVSPSTPIARSLTTSPPPSRPRRLSRSAPKTSSQLQPHHHRQSILARMHLTAASQAMQRSGGPGELESRPLVHKSFLATLIISA